MTGSVTSKSTVSPTCALEEETVRFRRRRTGVPSWSVSTWAVAVRTRKKIPASLIMNLSKGVRARGLPMGVSMLATGGNAGPHDCFTTRGTRGQTGLPANFRQKAPEIRWRSEEHTSELQSLRHLVCRLLLEKKKKSN